MVYFDSRFSKEKKRRIREPKGEDDRKEYKDQKTSNK